NDSDDNAADPARSDARRAHDPADLPQYPRDARRRPTVPVERRVANGARTGRAAVEIGQDRAGGEVAEGCMRCRVAADRGPMGIPGATDDRRHPLSSARTEI